MSYEVEVLSDCVAEGCPRLTTFRVKAPAMIHQEQLRHRSHSFSVSSMRAIPLAEQIRRVLEDPAMPIEWGSAKPGMQAGAQLDGDARDYCEAQWLLARDLAVERVRAMDQARLHKQVASRILQPWSHYHMVITAVAPGWINYFALRCHEAAQPEFRRLPVRMALAYRDSTPKVLGPGDWALPYARDEDYAYAAEHPRLGIEGDRTSRSLAVVLALSVARCGRVSFLHHGEVDRPVDKDIEFHDVRLKLGDWSVFEHQARVPRVDVYGRRENPDRLSGNLTGWVQYRQTLTPNVHRDFDFSVLEKFRSDWE